MKKKPLISVLMPSYNHEQYIGKAIESVLNQNFSDFELIISDDASSDNSIEIIKNYNDKRVKTNFFDENQGASLNMLHLLENVRGKYIAVISSDDIWLDGKLKSQVDFLENNDEYAACFTHAEFIDENDRILKYENPVFRQANRSKSEWVEHFFLNGNCLFHPSILVKADVYKKLYSVNIPLRQLPDFEMWVKLVRTYNIHIIQKNYALHRRFISIGENTSTPTEKNSNRDINESLYILQHYFDDLEEEIFVNAFKKHFRKKEKCSKEELICEQFFLYFDEKCYTRRMGKILALNFFLEKCRSKEIYLAFRDSYGYTMTDFHELSASVKTMQAIESRTSDQGLNFWQNMEDISTKTYVKSILKKHPRTYRVAQYIYTKFIK